MTKPARLRRDVVEFVLRLEEQRSPRTTRDVLDELDPKCCRELLENRLLVPDGIATSTMAIGDGGVTYRESVWNGARYEAFSAADGGLVPVDDAEIGLLRVDQPVWLSTLGDLLGLTGTGKPMELVSDLAWDLGDIWVSRTWKVPAIFARRIGLREIAAELREALLRRGPRRSCLILTSSGRPEDFPDCAVVPLHTAVTNDAVFFVVDRGVLLAPYGGPPPVPDGKSLYLSPDGTRLIINGTVHVSFRSVMQIELIRALVNAHHEGQRMRAATLLANAGSSAGSLKRAFGRHKWKLLEPYLKSRAGLWGFDL